MTGFVRLLKWILKAAVFFVLFAFALNNQQDATVHLAFGQQWRAPVTLIVLGVLGMLPGWWARRQRPAPSAPATPAAAVTAMPASPPPDGV